MKTSSSRIRIITMSLIALVALGFASKTFAAVDAFIIFKASDGKETKVTIAKDGSFTSPALSAGSYTVSWVFNNGPRQTTSLDGSMTRGISSPTGSSVDKKNKIEAISFQYGIVSPRDPASGLPTGKRMHKPFEVKVSSSERLLPTVNKKVATIAIDEPGVHITGMIEATDQLGNKMAVDDWQM